MALRLRFLLLLASGALIGLGAAGCGSGGPADTGRLNVVAAEDFWGSIASQLGGSQVEVRSVIANPAADPHDYEPTPEDARAFAEAGMSIVNGIGYDEWAAKLLAANPDSRRVELDVGEALGLADGDNPHQWYSPAAVHAVVDRITADYERADPGHRAYFQARRRHFLSAGLGRYERLIRRIRGRFAGTPVGASESVFEPLAAALGLRLLTPHGFLDAVAEGTEPTPADKAAADRQIADRQIRLWVFNSQNATPDVQRLNDAAGAAGIPVASVTETTSPEGASFQAWMDRELEALLAALEKGGGR
ncbi:MAG TPA: zinc ABC transporter substrate-binding protein [Solirubrobacterales bacterium]